MKDEKLIYKSCNKEIIYPNFSGIQKNEAVYLLVDECEYCGFNNWYEVKK